METDNDLLEQVNDSGVTDDLIRDFLYLIADNTLNHKAEEDAKAELIRSLFKEGFEIHSPDGTKKIGSKVIQQALWRVMSKVKFLNYRVHGTGQDENTELIVTEGIGTVADRGGLTTCFRDKGGVFQTAFLEGDGHLMYGRSENSECPIDFRVIRNEDIYTDNFCYGIRGVRPTNRLCAVFGFQQETAWDMWPELKENNITGRIPGTFRREKEDENKDNRMLEVAWGYNIAKKASVIFAGSQAFELDRFVGDEYPYVKNGKPFIPVFQFICQPSIDKYRNYGIGHMVYDLAVITRKLLNMEVGHIEENVYPVTLINAPQSKVDELVEKMAMANKARANGGKPFVAMEFGAGGGNVSAQTLTTQNLFNEWSAVWDRLYREISRLGINLDDVDRGSGYTRGQVIAEEESSNAFIKQMQEYNASESQELIECIMDGITEFVSHSNKSPLNLRTRLKLDDGSAKKLNAPITLGMLSKTLSEGNWFCEMDSRTGAITSDLMRLTQLESQLALTPPNSPEYNQIARELGAIRGVDYEPTAPAPNNANTANPTPATPEAPTSETERGLPPMSGSTLTQPI